MLDARFILPIQFAFVMDLFRYAFLSRSLLQLFLIPSIFIELPELSLFLSQVQHHTSFWCIALYSIAIATTYFLVYIFFHLRFFHFKLVQQASLFHLFLALFMFFLVGWLAGALLPPSWLRSLSHFLYNLLCHANKTRARQRNRMEFHTSLSFAFTWNIWKNCKMSRLRRCTDTHPSHSTALEGT